MSDGSVFVPGIELARAFYDEVVEPIVRPWEHGAAHLGWGSDVLGFDTERSTDHGWGPRLRLFVNAGDVPEVLAAVDEQLPAEFAGWPTRFARSDGVVAHHVGVHELRSWLLDEQLGVDATRDLTAHEWLTTPQQLLLGVVAGEVFADPGGRLEAVRRRLEWYPDDIWLWMLACQWRRIDQEEPFVGRAAEVGDDLGSRVIAARQAREVMRLCLLIERRYAPYSKWLGTAFSRLDSARLVGPPLVRALAADSFRSREAALVAAWEAAARLHNALDLHAPVDPSARPFFDRPFQVLFGNRFAEACLERIADPWLRALPLVGAVDQFVDSTDVLSHAGRPHRLGAVYDE